MNESREIDESAERLVGGDVIEQENKEDQQQPSSKLNRSTDVKNVTLQIKISFQSSRSDHQCCHTGVFQFRKDSIIVVSVK